MKSYHNYHEIDNKSKIENDGLLLLEHSLQGYAGKDVVINGVINTRVIISQRYDGDYTSKKILGRRTDIERGNLVDEGKYTYLVTTFPEDNGVYKKATMTLCNIQFPIEKGEVSTVVGTDSLGRPIIKKEKSIDNVPAVYIAKAYNILDNSEISLPDNYVDVKLQYHPTYKPKVNQMVALKGESFKVTTVDHEHVVNEVGFLEVRLERQVSTS